MLNSRDTEYIEKVNAAASRMEEVHGDMDGWNLSKTSKHVKIWSKKSAEYHGYMHRCECTVEGSLEKAFEHFFPEPIGSRLQWDKTLQLHECLAKLTEEVSLFRAITHSQFMGLIASREFVYALKVSRSLEEGWIRSTSISIDHPEYPVRDSPVRGINYPNGAYLSVVPGEKDKVKVVNYYNVDMGGRLPQSVLDSAIPQLMSSVLESFYKKMYSIKK